MEREDLFNEKGYHSSDSVETTVPEEEKWVSPANLDLPPDEELVAPINQRRRGRLHSLYLGPGHAAFQLGLLIKLIMYWFCKGEISDLAHKRSIGYSFIVVDVPTSNLLIVLPYIFRSQIDQFGAYILSMAFLSLGIGLFGSFAC